MNASALAQAWEEIAAELHHAGDRLFLQKKLSHGPLHMSAVIRVKDGMQGILLQCADEAQASAWTPKAFAGIRFEPAIRTEEGIGFPVMLAETTSLEIFALLAADLLSAMGDEGAVSTRLRRLQQRLSLWRRLLQNRTARMTEEEVRGLIGEISIWKQVAVKKGAAYALNAWRGPLGELHDFVFPGFRTEVKTWSNASQPAIAISDPAQIVFDRDFPVHIAAVQLSADTTAGRTLGEIVAGAQEGLSPEDLELFQALLADYGYIDSQAEAYTHRYAVVETRFYRIGEDFPRIEWRNLPTSIVWLKYALALNGLSAHEVTNPLS